MYEAELFARGEENVYKLYGVNGERLLIKITTKEAVEAEKEAFETKSQLTIDDYNAQLEAINNPTG